MKKLIFSALLFFFCSSAYPDRLWFRVEPNGNPPGIAFEHEMNGNWFSSSACSWMPFATAAGFTNENGSMKMGYYVSWELDGLSRYRFTYNGVPYPGSGTGDCVIVVTPGTPLPQPPWPLPPGWGDLPPYWPPGWGEFPGWPIEPPPDNTPPIDWDNPSPPSPWPPWDPVDPPVDPDPDPTNSIPPVVTNDFSGVITAINNASSANLFTRSSASAANSSRLEQIRDRSDIANSLLAGINSGVLSANNLTAAQMAAINAFILTAQGHYSTVEQALEAESGYHDQSAEFFDDVKDALNSLIGLASSNHPPVSTNSFSITNSISVTNSLHLTNSVLVTNQVVVNFTNDLGLTVTNMIPGLEELGEKIDGGMAPEVPVFSEIELPDPETQAMTDSADALFDGSTARQTFLSNWLHGFFSFELPTSVGKSSSMTINFGSEICGVSSVTCDLGRFPILSSLRSFLGAIINICTVWAAINIYKGTF